MWRYGQIAKVYLESIFLREFLWYYGDNILKYIGIKKKYRKGYLKGSFSLICINEYFQIKFCPIHRETILW